MPETPKELQVIFDGWRIIEQAAREVGILDPEHFSRAVVARLAHADILLVHSDELQEEEE